MNQLDEEIGDLDAFIKDTEALIVSDLEEEVLECESELRSTFSALADLDCILSLASCAMDLNFVRPTILSVNEGVIEIENGRHPLQELIVDDEFIPNDTMMDNTNRVLIVTGPNFSGKSCYARQVGVLVYLAHIGSYLPCDSARISIMDQIIVNFGEVETCSVPQSTFQRDMTQMAGIMHKCTPNTLVLIDEFGKGKIIVLLIGVSDRGCSHTGALFIMISLHVTGTAPTSGIAVMTAAMQRLAQSKCKVVCTTHFLECFSLGLLEDGKDGIKAVRMRIHVPETDEDDAIPLFKLEDGVASSSAGLVCARMAGLKRNVVDRASEIITALKEGTQVKPLAESMNANSPFQPNVRSAIRLFLAVDSWTNASDEDINLLQELVGRM
jgi:DNA mismatch repair protein MSH5